MIKESLNIETSNNLGWHVRCAHTGNVTKFGTLGKEIKISPKAHVSFQAPGYKAEYFVDTVTVVIGIGKDHVAALVLDIDAYNALLSGEKVSVTTNTEFKKKYM